jgi:hypothetical protein
MELSHFLTVIVPNVERPMERGIPCGVHSDIVAAAVKPDESRNAESERLAV